MTFLWLNYPPNSRNGQDFVQPVCCSKCVNHFLGSSFGDQILRRRGLLNLLWHSQYLINVCFEIVTFFLWPQEQLASALQDQRLVPFLARSMSSNSRDSVQKSLRILCEANSLPDFQAIWYALKMDTYQSVFPQP